jgi:hypothetical protein
MQFAMWEAKTLIPMLYHHFTFKLVENFKLRPSRCGANFSPSGNFYPAETSHPERVWRDGCVAAGMCCIAGGFEVHGMSFRLWPAGAAGTSHQELVTRCRVAAGEL